MPVNIEHRKNETKTVLRKRESINISKKQGYKRVPSTRVRHTVANYLECIIILLTRVAQLSVPTLLVI